MSKKVIEGGFVKMAGAEPETVVVEVMGGCVVGVAVGGIEVEYEVLDRDVESISMHEFVEQWRARRRAGPLPENICTGGFRAVEEVHE